MVPTRRLLATVALLFLSSASAIDSRTGPVDQLALGGPGASVRLNAPFVPAADPCPGDPENDIDSDGVCNDVDNCPVDANSGQEDGDNDGVGDVCDTCPVDPNPGQVPILLVESTQQIDPIQVSPDGEYVVYRVRAETGQYELYSVPTGGGAPVLLSPPQHQSRDVYAEFKISPDGRYVLYQSELGSGEVGFFSVPIEGGAPTQLYTTIFLSDSIQGFAASADGSRVVFRVVVAPGSLPSDRSLLSVPMSGGTPVILDSGLPGTELPFEITADSGTVVYRSFESGSPWPYYAIHSIPIDGGGSTPLSDPSLAGGIFWVAADSGYVLYLGSAVIGHPNSWSELYSVPVGGGASTKLNGPLLTEGFDSIQFSPDGSRVVYHADQIAGNLGETYSVPVTGGTPILLSVSMGAGAIAVPLLITPDGAQVLYIQRGTDPWWHLHSVPIDGGTPVYLAEAREAEISGDSRTAVYRVGYDLFSVPVDGGAATSLAVNLNSDLFGFFLVSGEFAVCMLGQDVVSIPVERAAPYTLARIPETLVQYLLEPTGRWLVFSPGLWENPAALSIYSVRIDQDHDGDSKPSACDPCPYDDLDDIDSDGLCGDVDNCPLVANSGQEDTDSDGVGDFCDSCPLDPDNDIDSDGICGDVDACPHDPDNDIDSDGICGDLDACPLDPDNDLDSDGICGDVDACPLDPHNDIDSDGICGDVDTCPLDPDNDLDSDGFCGEVDNCPLLANPGQQDADSDGNGDICDVCPLDPDNDIESDGICGDVDNCPEQVNPGQEDGERIEVRRQWAIGATASSEWSSGGNSAAQATGLPEPTACFDDPRAWAPLGGGPEPEWLELVYEIPVRATGIVVHETYTYGSVYQVDVVNDQGGYQTVWTGTDNSACGTSHTATWPETPFLVPTVRVHTAIDGWEEINAVELLGFGVELTPDGVGDACDNCPDLANAGQANLDGDPAGDLCDCEPSYGNIYPAAPEANDAVDNQCPGDAGYGLIDELSGDAGFHDPADRTIYSWPAQPGAASYEVARSSEADFASGCTTWQTVSTFVVDGEDPPAGATFHYLTRSVAPNVGSWGSDSAGIERLINCP